MLRADFGFVPRRRHYRAVILRRKRLPPDLVEPYGAFCAQVDRLEQARDALISCLPVGRVDPAPVPVGLDLLADTVADILREMPAWQVAELAEEWAGCVAGIEESKANMPRAHRVATASGELEELLGAVEDVDEPLGYAFGRAERRWRSLRR